MPKKLRQTQLIQRKQRLLKLALCGDWESVEEARKIILETPGFQDLHTLFGGPDDYQPWTIAARNNCFDMFQMYLELITNSGRDQNSIRELLDHQDPNGETPLSAASRGGSPLETVGLLLRAGASPNKNALKEAIRKCYPNVVDLMLEAGANPSQNALLVAAREGRDGAVHCLLQAGASATQQSLDASIRGGSCIVVKQLIDAGAVPTKEMLKVAVQYEKLAIAKILLQAGVRTTEEMLLLASRPGLRTRYGMADLLLEHGNEVQKTLSNIFLTRDWAMLLTVMKKRQSAVVYIPPAEQTEQEQKDLLYDLSLWLFRHQNSWVPFVFRHILRTGLLDDKVFVLIQNVHTCCQEYLSEILSYIAKKGLDQTPDIQRIVNVVVAKHGGSHPKIGKQLVRNYGANVDAKDGSGETALASAVRSAARYNRMENVSALLELGASAEAFSMNGGTIFVEACRVGTATLVERLIKSGTRIDGRGMGGATALHYAVLRGRTEIVDLLLRNGADPTLKTSKGKFAMDMTNEFERELWHFPRSLIKGKEVCSTLLDYWTLKWAFYNKSRGNLFRCLADIGEETANALLHNIMECLVPLECSTSDVQVRNKWLSQVS